MQLKTINDNWRKVEFWNVACLCQAATDALRSRPYPTPVLLWNLNNFKKNVASSVKYTVPFDMEAGELVKASYFRQNFFFAL